MKPQYKVLAEIYTETIEYPWVFQEIDKQVEGLKSRDLIQYDYPYAHKFIKWAEYYKKYLSKRAKKEGYKSVDDMYNSYYDKISQEMTDKYSSNVNDDDAVDWEPSSDSVDEKIQDIWYEDFKRVEIPRLEALAKKRIGQNNPGVPTEF